jgi:hypothetical protein
MTTTAKKTTKVSELKSMAAAKSGSFIQESNDRPAISLLLGDTGLGTTAGRPTRRDGTSSCLAHFHRHSAVVIESIDAVVEAPHFV